MMKILLIDDDPAIRRTFERHLTRAGHAVCWASTRSGAIALMHSEKPGLVLLDLDLGPNEPGGLSILADKLADPSIAGIPTAIVTGSKQIKTISEPIYPLRTVLFVMAKPPDFKKLLATIDILEGKKGNSMP
jgi:DNA-binding NtrC family response regulator